MTAALFLYQVIDTSSRVVPGATLRFMQGFRPGAIYHDPEQRTPARNPFPADGAGRVRLYLNAGETYEVTVESPNGDRYQFVHVARADGETVEVVREVPVETVIERIVPDPEQAARIAELEARLAEKEAKAEPQPTDYDAIIAGLQAQIEVANAAANDVPESLREFVREGEPHGEAQARLWKLYNNLTGLLMSGLATQEQIKMHTRLHGALYWVSRAAVDVI